jgi:hypothetical protein
MQEPLPYLSYATPSDQPTPTSVRVISIIGICIGGLTLLYRLLLLFRDVYGIATGRNVFISLYRFYTFCSEIIFTGFAVFLLASAIGCLRRQELARVWIVRYAISYLIALVADILLTVGTYCLLINRYVAGSYGGSRSVFYPRLLTISVGSLGTAIFACILPILILIYMRRPAVRAVFL